MTSITHNVLLIDWPSSPPKHAVSTVTSAYPNISKVTNSHLCSFAPFHSVSVHTMYLEYSKDNLVFSSTMMPVLS